MASNKDKMGGICITQREMGNEYKILVRNPKEKRMLWTRWRTRRWDDNIRIILNKLGLREWVLSDLHDSRSK